MRRNHGASVIRYELYLRETEKKPRDPDALISQLAEKHPVKPHEQNARYTIAVGPQHLTVRPYVRQNPSTPTTSLQPDSTPSLASIQQSSSVPPSASMPAAARKPKNSAEDDRASPACDREHNGYTASSSAPCSAAAGLAFTPAHGLDFVIPTGLTEETAREMIEIVCALADHWEMVIYDPQMGRTVTQADLESIVMNWKEQNDYLLRTVGGDGSTVGGGAHYPEYTYGLSPKAKFWLFVAGLVVLFFALARFCT